MDFYQDTLNEGRRWLETWGVKEIHTGTDPNKAKPTPVLTPVEELSDSEFGVAFFRTLHRLPRAIPRTFEQSSEPLPELSEAETAGLAQLKVEVEAGLSLWPRLSRTWVRGQTDGLLSEWSIFHFHLGDKLQDARFVTRSCHVALAMVTQTRFLLIAVRPHGKGCPPPWYDKNYLELVNAHWPEELRSLPEDFTLAFDVDGPDMIRDLRKAGVTVLLNVGGRILMPPGGGMSADGGSSRAVLDHNAHYYRLKHWEQAWAAQFSNVPVKLTYFPDAGFLLVGLNHLWWAHDTENGSAEFWSIPPLYAVYLQQRASRFPQLWSIPLVNELRDLRHTWSSLAGLSDALPAHIKFLLVTGVASLRPRTGS